MLEERTKPEASEELPPSPAAAGKRIRPVRHRWFDQWLIARSEPLKQLVGDITTLVEGCEQRLRARRPEDERHHRRMVEGVVCNLAYALLIPPPTGWVTVPTRNGSHGKQRYDNRAFGKPFTKLLDLLADKGVLDRQRPRPVRGETGSIRPSKRFMDLVQPLNIGFADFASDPSREVVLLTRVTRTFSPETKRTRKSKKLVEYADTPISRAYRIAVQELNAFLDAADITFLDDGGDPVVDPHIRTLTRHFIVFDNHEPRFDQVGRLFGGFWMTLKKERRKRIRINGEPVADLDFSSMFTRLAYADMGLPAPDGDLYAVPGLEDYRDGVKLAMNCLLFDETKKRRSWPNDLRQGYATDVIDATEADLMEDDAKEGKLPDGWTVSRTKKAILSVHPALGQAWGRGLGYRVMWQESEILMAVLRELMDRGIPALGLHDGLLVPVSGTEVALQAMRRASKQVVGVELPCAVKA